MLSINTGLYTYRLTGIPPKLLPSIKELYPDSTSNQTLMADYQIDIVKTSILRSIFRPQVAIKIDGHQPFNPISPDKLLPSIEWAMNWCVAAYDHNNLLIHCSVVEKNGKVILFPAISGSGKSTTSAFLGLHGWHVFYDEMAVIDLKSGVVKPVFRPISLKNNSVDIIKPFINEQNQGYMSEIVHGTHKGTIGHLRTLDRLTFDQLTSTLPSAVVFLDYRPNNDLNIYEVDKSIGFSKLISNSFNYSVIGEPAFNMLTDLINHTSIYEASYSNLPSLVEFLEELVSD